MKEKRPSPQPSIRLRSFIIASLLTILFLPPGGGVFTHTPPNPLKGIQPNEWFIDENKPIYLHLYAINGDPLQSFPSSRFKGKFYIVQFYSPVGSKERNIIEKHGGIIHYYIPDFAYLVEIAPDNAKKLMKERSVRWVGPYLPMYKYNMDIFRALKDVNRPLLDSYVEEDKLPFSNPIIVDISTFNGYSKGVSDVISQYGIVLYKGDIQVRAIIPEDSIERTASIEGVEWIEPAPLFKVRNDVARVIINVSGIRASLGLRGDGQTVAVCDSGLDTGVDNHSVNGDIHLDFDNRVYFFNLYGSSPDDKNGHGTHVTGSLAGNGARSNGRYAGMAPNATIIMQAAGDDQGSGYVYVTNFYNVLLQAYNHGARIHSDSWGSDDYGYYSRESRDADRFVWSHKNMTVFIAAGNTGPSSGTVGSPATAKNILAVGACGGYNVNNANNMASFSARGPTSDGRLKPDIVSPGTYITSCKSSKVGGSGYYYTASGTSMATPLAAGTGALFREYFMHHNVLNPSSALIKALMLVGANDITGSGASSSTPNYAEGWGRLNITESLTPSMQKRTTYREISNGLQTGGTYTTHVFIVNNAYPFRSILTWNDYPPSMSASIKLVNDLDLEVVSPSGGIYYGNDFTSPYNSTKDRKNNVEGVIIQHPEVGEYTIRVKGYNIPNGPQPFALAFYGGISTAAGVVDLSPKIISTDGGVGTVILLDSNLTGSGTSSVHINSTSDTGGFNLSLTEEPLNSGFFHGNFTVVNRSANHLLRELKAEEGDTIRVVYKDLYPLGTREAIAVAMNPPRILLITHDAPISTLTVGGTVRITLIGTGGTMAKASLVGLNPLLNFTLYDDGKHNDRLANDGIYSNIVGINSVMTGEYRVLGYLFKTPNFYVEKEADKPIVVNTSLPRAPFNINVTVDTRGRGLNLTWKVDNIPISYFLVFRSTSPEGPFELLNNISRYVRYYKDTGLKNGIEYFYTLKLKKENGPLSGFSKIVSGIPKDLTGPILMPISPISNRSIGTFTRINLSVSNDTNRLIFYYTFDQNHDGLPDLNQSWHYIINVSSNQIPYIWDTRKMSGGPGEGRNVTLLVRAWDNYNNTRSLYIINLTVDNTPPDSPVIIGYPPVVNTTSISVEGFSEKGATIKPSLNGHIINDTVQSDVNGSFKLTINLPKEGVYNLFLLSYDSVGNGPSMPSKEFTVVVDLTPPTARFDIPQAALSNHIITLDGSLSSDVGPSEQYSIIVYYMWIIEDGKKITLYGNNLGYYFNTTGVHRITLLVKDAAGNWDILTKEITIEDSMPPHPVVTGNMIVNEDELSIFSAENTKDDDPTILETGNFSWGFTDGSPREFYGTQLRYIFYTPGEYTITLTVIDRSSHKSTLTFNIKVRDLTPPKAVPPINKITQTSHPYLFDGTRSNDNDPLFYNTGEVEWAFKDGGKSILLSGFKVVYFFNSSGVHHVNMTVSDSSNNTDSLSFDVIVSKDTTPPYVVDYSPSSLKELPLKPTITIFFSEEIPFSSQKDKIKLINGDNSIDIELTFPLPNAISIAPKNNLSLQTNYTIVISKYLKDWASLPLGETYIIKFNTLSYLNVLHVYPLDYGGNLTKMDLINITFTRPLNSSILNEEYLKNHIRILDSSGKVVPLDLTIINSQRLELKPIKPFKEGEKYKLIIDKEIKDEMGISFKEDYEREMKVAGGGTHVSFFERSIFGIPLWVVFLLISVLIIAFSMLIYHKHQIELNEAEEIGDGVYKTRKGETFILQMDDEDDDEDFRDLK